MHILKYIHKILFHLFGLNIKTLLSLYNLPRYLRDIFIFRSAKGKINSFFPILYDFNESAGNIKNHYFHQDLHVSSKIYLAKPRNHLDVGSRIDGFISNIAVFMEVSVLDIRKLEIKKKNINFKKGDITNTDFSISEKFMSISCLHTLEHFGLGRYGDQINPKGHVIGFYNLYKMLDRNGLLYVSFPIASKTKIEFNAHRIFNYLEIFNWIKELDIQDLELISFDLIDDNSNFLENQNINKINFSINFGCGIYTFKKK